MVVLQEMLSRGPRGQSGAVTTAPDLRQRIRARRAADQLAPCQAELTRVKEALAEEYADYQEWVLREHAPGWLSGVSALWQHAGDERGARGTWP